MKSNRPALSLSLSLSSARTDTSLLRRILTGRDRRVGRGEVRNKSRTFFRVQRRPGANNESSFSLSTPRSFNLFLSLSPSLLRAKCAKMLAEPFFRGRTYTARLPLPPPPRERRCYTARVITCGETAPRRSFSRAFLQSRSCQSLSRRGAGEGKRERTRELFPRRTYTAHNAIFSSRALLSLAADVFHLRAYAENSRSSSRYPIRIATLSSPLERFDS